jgi:multicomponent Na+:H+ antiporter subunit G
VRAIFYDVMVLVSLSVMTLGIVGILRMPDIYTKLHGASKSVFLGVVLLSISATVVATPEMIDRIILISLLVVMTTPISSHVIGHAAYRMQERMETPGAVDESHTLVPGSENPEEPTWRL